MTRALDNIGRLLETIADAFIIDMVFALTGADISVPHKTGLSS